MAKAKLGIGTLEINKRFKDKDEAYKYARRLQQFIYDTCNLNKDKGYIAQAMIVISETKGKLSSLRYKKSGNVGRPKAVLEINDLADKFYGGIYKTDWHLHILVVSRPSITFRNKIKKYIDKNWFRLENRYEVDFDVNDLKKKVYKKYSNINIAQYYIDQSSERLFCDCSNGEFEYSLEEYYRAYLNGDNDRRKLYRKSAKKEMAENKYFEELEKLNKRFNDIEEYYYKLTEKEDKEMVDNFVKSVKERTRRKKLSKVNEYYLNMNKVQKKDDFVAQEDSIFLSD